MVPKFGLDKTGEETRILLTNVPMPAPDVDMNPMREQPPPMMTPVSQHWGH